MFFIKNRVNPLNRQLKKIMLKRMIIKRMRKQVMKELIKNRIKPEVIPRNIFQAWHCDILPNSVKASIANIKKYNPNFNHYLYNNEKCREFIKKYFSEDVLNTYDAIIPAAIKIDLWRYCVLYKFGGVYLDVKYYCINGFNFNYLLDKEYFCKDFDKVGVYNAIIICKPNNEIMKNCIYNVVRNVNNNYYGKTLTDPTGPLMIKKYFSDNQVNHFLLNVTNGLPNNRNKENTNIKYRKFNILHFHENYRNEQPRFNKYWADCWKDKEFYDINKIDPMYDPDTLFTSTYNSNIPKVIYMCHKKLDKIKIYSKKWKDLNPEYEIKLYDDELCKKFLLEEYSPLHLDVFNYIKDGPIKADFWRVCIINKYGGLYVDAYINPLVPLNTYIENNDDFVTCISNNDSQINPHFIMSNKNNPFLIHCMNTYINMYKHKIKYSYAVWGISMIMKINYVKQKKSQIILINNLKYKFLLELNDYNTCVYNGIKVLHNRYEEYVNHDFIYNSH